ncbi:MAG: tRNA preQ1(34) S-adenosylmethionine ribosyltransferase-isomerase QueA [Myxococcota bacterium]
MRLDELDYDLPNDRIARHPADPRSAARLLRVRCDRTGPEAIDHGATVADLPSLLPPRSLLVVNDTRVMPARVFGEKAATGGKVELLLVSPRPADAPPAPQGRGGARWSVLAKASKRIQTGAELRLDGGVRAWVERGVDDEGLFTVRFSIPKVESWLEEVGHMPLPPYLGRPDEAFDRERYQTVFADAVGAVAAPTAGLHFDPPLLDALAKAGHTRVPITLHVGPGTFRPVKVDDLDDHPMHREWFSIREQTAVAIRRARSEGRKVFAIGTTVVRALESACDSEGRLEAVEMDTRLLIQPGYRFRVIDGLMTNFHLPRSTLLALVYAFGGRDRIREAYRQAIEERYRFYSYGDAMLIESGLG